jgi:hypothetical protein
MSANRKADLALSAPPATATTQPHNATSVDPETEVRRLAEVYNQIRKDQRSGPSRTAAMTSVVREMIALAPRLPQFDVRLALESKDRGTRLMAYAYLYARPDIENLSALVKSVTEIEAKPFGQYWGLQAIQKILEQTGPQNVDFQTQRKLRDFQHHLASGTDRYYELKQILRGLGAEDEPE